MGTSRGSSNPQDISFHLSMKIWKLSLKLSPQLLQNLMSFRPLNTNEHFFWDTLYWFLVPDPHLISPDPRWLLPQASDEGEAEEDFGTSSCASTQRHLWNLFENPHHSRAAKVSQCFCWRYPPPPPQMQCHVVTCPSLGNVILFHFSAVYSRK